MAYNVENLFERAVAMDQKTWAEGSKALALHAEMNAILGKIAYSAADKKRIVAIMRALKIDKKDDGGKYAILRQNRGHLVTSSRRHSDGRRRRARATGSAGSTLKTEPGERDREAQHGEGDRGRGRPTSLPSSRRRAASALRRFSDGLLRPSGASPIGRSCSSTATTSGASTSAS